MSQHLELLAHPLDSMDFDALVAAEGGDIELLTLEPTPSTGNDIGLCERARHAVNKEGRVRQAKGPELPSSSRAQGRPKVRRGSPFQEAAAGEAVGREEEFPGPEESRVSRRSLPARPAGSSSPDALPDECFSGELSFFKWAAALPRLLLATRTSFAPFIFCYHISCGQSCP